MHSYFVETFHIFTQNKMSTTSSKKSAPKFSRSNSKNTFLNRNAPSLASINLVSTSPPSVNSLNNTARSLTGSKSLASNVSSSALSESQSMMYAEIEQRHLGDSFWGLDRDLADRINENSVMDIEDRLSKAHEFMHFTASKHKQWDAELEMQSFYESKNRMQNQDFERSHHLKLLTSSTASTEDLIASIWRSVSVLI